MFVVVVVVVIVGFDVSGDPCVELLDVTIMADLIGDIGLHMGEDIDDNELIPDEVGDEAESGCDTDAFVVGDWF